MNTSPALWAADFLQKQQPALLPPTQTFRQNADPSSMQNGRVVNTPVEATTMNSPFQGETSHDECNSAILMH